VAPSEHPAPSAKWRRNGGHNTLDPVAALSFMAAVTARIKLMTNLYVLPYRNPYLTAKALGSLDLISSGRRRVHRGFRGGGDPPTGGSFDCRTASTSPDVTMTP
jgi:alkanesulfonate monooxygenase SsuD/methylene tetrahydromethanopterin reductase-like flavin-dependent oxidoreductase (luciferase family)